MRTSATLAGLLLTAGLLAGCGSDGSPAAGGGGGDDRGGSYCDELKAAQQEFESVTGGADADLSALDDAIARIQEIADKAPAAVEEEWGTLEGALTQVTDALEDAGVTLDDLSTMMETQELPEGVTMADLAQIGEDVQSLDDEGLQEAADTIAQHAEDECGIQLNPEEEPTS